MIWLAIKRLRIAIKQAGDAAEKFGQLADSSNTLINSDARPLIADLRKTVADAGKAMDALNKTIAEAQPGVANFSNQTMPEVNLLIRDLREMAESLTAVSERLNRGGASSLVGSQRLPDYKGNK